MKVHHTKFNNLLIIEHKSFIDNRGFFKELYRKNVIEEQLDYKLEFCQDNFVTSNYMVLRGLHFQNEPYQQSKLITVFDGEILDIAVDLRKKSKTYGKYFSYLISASKNKSLFIPKGFAHGYLTLSKKACINYKVDNYYNPKEEAGIKYNDKFLNIDWNVDHSKIIVSEKDKNFDNFKW